MRARFASKELSLACGLECHPEDGQDRPQMLVRRMNNNVMSNDLESGATPDGGNSLSHCGFFRILPRKREWRVLR